MQSLNSRTVSEPKQTLGQASDLSQPLAELLESRPQATIAPSTLKESTSDSETATSTIVVATSTSKEATTSTTSETQFSFRVDLNSELKEEDVAGEASVPVEVASVDSIAPDSEPTLTEDAHADELARFQDRRKRIPRPRAMDAGTYATKLSLVPELRLNKLPDEDFNQGIFERAGSMRHPIEMFVNHKPELQGLPFQLGNACLSDSDRIHHLATLGPLLKTIMGNDVDLTTFFQSRFNISDNFDSTVPAVYQVYQSESPTARSQILKVCASSTSPESTRAIAKRAMFENDPDVRDQAIELLKQKDVEQYQGELLDGLRYPFAPIVQNAAIAIAELKLTAAMPQLRAMLDEPDPDQPQYAETDSSHHYVRELVRVNHFSNCTLCHAPSTKSTDPLRGFVPKYGQEIPPSYYAVPSTGSANDRFIRADVTYLKQDFAIKYTALDESQWPDQKRFDFFVRVRPAFTNEIEALDRPDNRVSDYKKALVFALRRLSEIDYGDSVDAWKQNLDLDTTLMRNTIALPASLDQGKRKLFSTSQMHASAKQAMEPNMPASRSKTSNAKRKS